MNILVYNSGTFQVYEDDITKVLSFMFGEEYSFTLGDLNELCTFLAMNSFKERTLTGHCPVLVCDTHMCTAPR